MALIFSAMAAFTPLCFDDLAYLFEYHRLPAGASWMDWVRFEENGRPANMLCPMWIESVAPWARFAIEGIITATAIWLMAVVAGRPKASWQTIVVAWALATLLLPWRGRLFVIDYWLNYIPATALYLATILAFTRVKTKKTAPLFALFFLACITAAQHEGLVVCLAFGIGTVAIAERLKLSAAQWVIIAGVAIGGAWLLSSPGIWIKAQYFGGVFSWKEMVKTLAPLLLLFVIIIVQFLVKSMRRKCKSLWSDSLTILLLGACMGGIILCLKTAIEPRVPWFGNVAAIVMLIMIINSCVNMKTGISIMLIIVTTSFWAAVVYTQFNASKKIIGLEQEIAENPTHTAYGTLPLRSSWSLMCIPQVNIWGESTHITAATMDGTPRAVVPEALMHFDRSHLRPIAGNAGAIDYKGVALLPNRPIYRLDFHGRKVPDNAETTTLRLEWESGRVEQAAPIMLIKFVAAPADTFLLVRPLLPGLEGPYKSVGN